MQRAAPWLLSLAALSLGCQLLVGIDPSDIHPGTGGQGATTSAGTGGTGGVGGGAAACEKPADCPGVDGECRSRSCVAGRCGFTDAPAGTPTQAQTQSDCRQRVCDGLGGTKIVNDPTDPLDDGNECTADTCQSGLPRNTASLAGMPCGNGRTCDDTGACVACSVPTQCGGDLCVNSRCVPATCTDLAQGGAETGVDCGGPTCGPCLTGGACLVGADCQSGVCGGAPRACLAPTCSDGLQNGDESDADCGGGCAARCAAGRRCHVDEDCSGGLCSGTVCLPACNDGLRNGSETGVDCGGACPPCALSEGCLFDADCAEGLCRGARCVPASCADGAPGALETGVDCGGVCAPCPPGQPCASGADCQSGVCAGTLCAKAACTDHTRNAAETGVDCGGPACAKCPDGQGCAGPGDCASGICLSGTCAQASCADGLLDQGESDVDCGGACPGCAGGKACQVGADCASTVCDAGACTTATCHDALTNGGETDLDCGGPCGACAEGQGCLIPGDCVTTACSGGKCVPATCSDGLKNGVETGVDCGGPTCPACAGGQGCLVPGDCATGVCMAGVCTPSCGDLLLDGDESDVDCGGTCSGCPGGKACHAGADCASHVCAGGACALPTCADLAQNGSETDVDCGGTLCGPCPNDKACVADRDCVSAGCIGGVCVEKLVLSQVRTRGAGGADDEFLELYNPGGFNVVLGATWKIEHQGAAGGCTASVTRFAGGGQQVPPHRHLLIANPSYTGVVTPDAMLLGTMPNVSLEDAGSLALTHAGKLIDAVCYSYDSNTAATLASGCAVAYVCEGMALSNLPHDNTGNASSNVDTSLERKPGGNLGNTQDSGDNKADFQVTAPAKPHNLASPAAP
jgi:hypothetical protein